MGAGLSIGRKVTIGGSILCVVMLALAIALSVTAMRAEGLSRTAQAAATLSKALDGLKSGVVKAHNAVLGMMSSADLNGADVMGRYLADLDEQRAHLLATLDVVGADETSRAQVGEIDGLVARWVETVVTPQLADMQRPDTVDMARVRETMPDTQALFARLDSLIVSITESARAASKDALNVMVRDQRIVTIASGVSGLVLVLVMMWAVLAARSMIVKPLRRLTNVTDHLREHDWDVEIPGADRGDELGALAKSLVILRDEGRENDERSAAARKKAEQELEQAVTLKSAAENFDQSSGDVLDDLAAAGEALSSAARSLGEMASESYAYTQNVTTSAQSTGNSVQSVAAAIEEMSISVREVSRQVTDASALTERTSTDTEQAVENVSTLLEKSKKIHEVIDLINGIAGQINLLALNATIESARAGEAGKGFAVVAQQVKELADQTGSATDEITKVITEVNQEIGIVVKSIEQIGSSIKSVNQNSSAIAAAVEEQSAAITEISENVGVVSSRTASVVDNVKSVETKVGETQTLAEGVGELSVKLKSSSTRMGSEIEQFILAATRGSPANTP